MIILTPKGESTGQSFSGGISSQNDYQENSPAPVQDDEKISVEDLPF